MMAATPDWLTPAIRMPWPVQVPFRMRPNLEKLDTDSPALLLHDDLASVYARERARVLALHGPRAAVGVANADALIAIRTLSPSPPVGEGGAERRERGIPAAPINAEGGTGALHPLPHPSPLKGEGLQIALSLQEDFAILKQEAGTLRTEYLSVCFPSRWDPREKLGLDFMAIHQPVADSQMLQAAGPNLMAMAFMKQPMLRHVWLIVPNPALDQHPDNNVAWWREALADPSPLLPRLYFRIERQTTWPLPQFERAVFFIRLLMSPLLDVLHAAPGRAAELAASLRSMTPAIVAYRGMTDALPRLLAELDQLVATQPPLPRSPGEAGRG